MLRSLQTLSLPSWGRHDHGAVVYQKNWTGEKLVPKVLLDGVTQRVKVEARKMPLNMVDAEYLKCLCKVIVDGLPGGSQTDQDTYSVLQLRVRKNR